VFYFGTVGTQKLRPDRLRLLSDDMTYEFLLDPAKVRTGTTADGNQSASVELVLDENALHKIPFLLSSSSFRMEVYCGGRETVGLTQEQKEDMLMVMDCYQGLVGR
jgi:hypothetical protein